MRAKAVFFGLSLLAILAAPLACAQQATDAQILHLLNRASFGPAPGDIDAVRQMGIGAYIEQQLRPENLAPNAALEQRLAALPTLNQSLPVLAEAYALPQDAKDLPEDQRKELQKRQNSIVQELAEAKLLRAIASPAQLQEVMVDFWYNHFNVFAEKGQDKWMVSSYERDAIRPYVLGKFSDLLNATAHHPAKLFYLDNWLNTDPDSPAARGRKIGINENYARELMELHTLGVDGGYRQADVTTLAHILTGWGLSEGREEYQRASFFFDPRRHDFNTYKWLGTTIRGGGEGEVEQVLTLLARSPATAHHIAYELAQYFVADDPPPALVDRLDASFRGSGGDIADMLRALFQSPEFWDARNSGQKFKPPLRYVVSTLRATGAMPQGDTRMLQGVIAQMGEPLYHCQTPNGYAATNDQWLNSDALLKRIDFAQKISGLLGPNAAPWIVNALGSDNIGGKTLAAVQAADARLKPALLLGSPEFVSY